MKKDLRIIKTRESLRHALLHLLKKKSIESITIAELCRLAQINRGTFYLHYNNVHEVFKDYFDVIVEDLRKSYEEPYYRTNYQIKAIKADMIKIFHHVKNYQEFYQIIFDERIPMMYYYLLFNTIQIFIKDSIEKGEFIAQPGLQINYLTSYQTNAIIGILIEWHRHEYTTSIEELNDQLIMILTYTNLARKD